MPSSTSSSERPVPAGDWRTIWIVALTVALVSTYLCERAIRAQGQRPSVVDDPLRWSVARRRVNDDPKAVAFVGTSRLQLALSLETARELMPDRNPVQLAINGVPAPAILADLAADPDFRGLAVVDIDEWDIAWDDPLRGAAPYIARSHELWRAPGALANRMLAGFAQERLAVLAVGGRPLATSIVKGRLPAPTWVASDRDRVGHGDYSLATQAALQAKANVRHTNFSSPAMPPQDWLARAAKLEPYVRAIKARGGDVVFARLPVSGKLLELFEQHYPRTQYWNAFAASTSARAVHFLDVPGMQVVCPDEMHVDQRDQAAVTRALVQALR